VDLKLRKEWPQPSPRQQGGGLPGTQTGPPDARLQINARPVRHYGQWIAAVVITALIVMLAIAVYQNPYIDHRVIGQFLFAHLILSGLRVTIELTIISMAIGIVIGVVLGLFRQTDNVVLQKFAVLYIWAFRGTPLIVQILLWGNFGLLFRNLDLGIPFTHLIAFSVKTNSVVTVFVASILALALNEGAYMAEVVRGGILAVDRGQTDAAMSLGMTHGRAMRRIVIPQAIRVIIPPTGNELINLLKASALVSVIAGGDLLTVTEEIYSQNYRTLELLIVASLWYIAVVTVANIGQHYLEKHYRRSEAGYLQKTHRA
jgi:polar amino acid transport system permease protein